MRGRLSSRANYIEVSRLKSGAFIYASLEAGAILGGGTADQVAALHRCGEQLGIAYQIVNDLLTYTGDESRSGKDMTTDVRNQVVSLPIINALEMTAGAEHQFVLDSFTGPPCTSAEETWSRVRDLLESSGASERTREDALGLLAAAQTHLDLLPSGTGTARLRELAELCVPIQM